MTARLSLIQEKTRGHRPRLQLRQGRNSPFRRLLERVSDFDQPRFAARHPCKRDAERGRFRVEGFGKGNRGAFGTMPNGTAMLGYPGFAEIAAPVAPGNNSASRCCSFIT